jgi:hypothetical protein
MRGYLWENLGEEIAEEFKALAGSQPDLRVDRDARRVWYKNDINYTNWSAKESARLPDKLIQRLKVKVVRDAGKKSAKLRREAAERANADCNGIGCHHRSCKRKPKKQRKIPKPRVPPTLTDYQLQYQKRKAMQRLKLPMDREGITQKFTLIARNFDRTGAPLEGVQEIKGYITASVYPNKTEKGEPHPMAGRLGEVFVKMGTPGDVHVLLDEWAVSLSRELQRGEDPVVLLRKHRFTRFEPSGMVQGIEGVTTCTSPTDLVCHWLERRFLGIDDKKGDGQP